MAKARKRRRRVAKPAPWYADQKVVWETLVREIRIACEDVLSTKRATDRETAALCVLNAGILGGGVRWLTPGEQAEIVCTPQKAVSSCDFETAGGCVVTSMVVGGKAVPFVTLDFALSKASNLRIDVVPGEQVRFVICRPAMGQAIGGLR